METTQQIIATSKEVITTQPDTQPYLVTNQEVIKDRSDSHSKVHKHPVGSYSLAPGRGTRDWSSGTFDCCEDKKTCCLVFWCPYCYLCCMYKSYKEFLCVPLCSPFSDVFLRVKHRNRHGIRGTVITDCCCASFCFSCSICQVKRDMDYIKNELGLQL